MSQRENAEQLIQQAIAAERLAIDASRMDNALDIWDNAILKSAAAPDVLVARFFSKSFQKSVSSGKREAEAIRLLEVLPDSARGRSRLQQWLDEKTLNSAHAKSSELLGRGDAVAALAVWDELLRQSPDNPEVHAARLTARAYRENRVLDDFRKDIDQFVNVAIEASKSVPNQSEQLLDWINPIEETFVRNEQIGVAALVWDEFMRRLPDNLFLRAGRFVSPVCRISLGTNAAIDEGRLLLQTKTLDDSTRYAVYAVMDELYLDKDDIEASRRLWDDWIEEFPEARKPRERRGDYRFRHHDLAGALVDYEMLIESLGALHQSGHGTIATTFQPRAIGRKSRTAQVGDAKLHGGIGVCRQGTCVVAVGGR